MAAFSIFLCILGDVASYLFYSERPTEVNWWIHPTIFPLNKQKEEWEKRLRYRCFPVNFREFLRTHFLRTLQVGCLWRWIRRNQATPHDIPIEQLFFLSDSSWIILAIHFSIAGQKLKWGKINGSFHFCVPLKRAVFLSKKLFSQNYIPLSYPHYIHHTKYTQKVDKPMIYVMIASKSDIRYLILQWKRINCYGKFCFLTRNLVHLVCFAIWDK